METTARKTDIDRLVKMLQEQDAKKLDLVVPHNRMRFVDGGKLRLETRHGDGASRLIRLDPNNHFEQNIASRLDIPYPYYKRMKEQTPELLDRTVNTWLDVTPRNHFVRGFAPNGGDGIARSIHSDRFKVIDNLDVLMASLEAIRSTGAAYRVESADLTERKMMVRLYCPDVYIEDKELLEGYLPSGAGTALGRPGHEAVSNVVWAGLMISNSEVGAGAFSIWPRLVIERCVNGWKVTVDVQRKAHLGTRMDEGVVRWSEKSKELNMELVISQTKDAVTTFTSRDYVQGWADDMKQAKGRVLDHPVEAVENVASKLGFTQEQQQGILDWFVKSGDLSAFGLGQAVTRFAQDVQEAEVADDLETVAPRAVEEALVLAAA